jgi:hypothetical protein
MARWREDGRIDGGEGWQERVYNIEDFLLDAELTPGPKCNQKDYVNANFHDTMCNQTLDLPVCSVVPKPTATCMPPSRCKLY